MAQALDGREAARHASSPRQQPEAVVFRLKPKKGGHADADRSSVHTSPLLLACPITEALPWPTSEETSPYGQRMDRSTSKVTAGTSRSRRRTDRSGCGWSASSGKPADWWRRRRTGRSRSSCRRSRSGVDIESAGHTPWSCPRGCGPQDLESGARRAHLGEGPMRVRLSTVNGPVSVR